MPVSISVACKMCIVDMLHLYINICLNIISQPFIKRYPSLLAEFLSQLFIKSLQRDAGITEGTIVPPVYNSKKGR